MTNKLKFTQVSRVICPKTGIHYLDAIDENGIHWVAQQEIGVGIFAMTAEELSQAGKKSGISSIPKQERIENGKKGGKIVSSQRWECCETGYVSTAAGVVAYQRARGIDTSNRRRIA